MSNRSWDLIPYYKYTTMARLPYKKEQSQNRSTFDASRPTFPQMSLIKGAGAICVVIRNRDKH